MAALEGFDPTGGFDSADYANQLGGAGGSLVIEQIEGDARTKVTLAGRAMPYQPVPFGGKQRTKKTVYPGNPVATQQVLGPEEDDTACGGVWKAPYIQRTINVNGSLDTVRTVSQAVDLFHRLRRAGRAVRVQWLDEVRIGLIVGFVPNWLSDTDCQWQLTFEWSARDDEVTPRTARAVEPASDLLNQMNDLEDLFTLAPLAIERFTAKLVSSIDGLKQRVAKVFGILRAVEAALNLPAAVLGALRTAVSELENEFREYEQRLEGRTSVLVDARDEIKLGMAGSHLTDRSGVGTPSTARGTRTSAVPVASAETLELTTEVWRRTMLERARRIVYSAQRKELELSNQVLPARISRRVVRKGENLYTIAAQIYGSPDYASFLARANRLDSALVPPGFELKIPPRQGLTVEPASGQRQEC